MSKPVKESAGTATVTKPTDREIRIERIFDAPRDRVWRAFTDPALVAQWWGRGSRLDIERLEVKCGGHWRFVEHSPDGVHGLSDAAEGSGRSTSTRSSRRASARPISGSGQDSGWPSNSRVCATRASSIA